MVRRPPRRNPRPSPGVDPSVPPVTELAVLSLHSSPLTQPGVGDSGGMNVYVRELAASLAQSGVGTTVYVRRWAEHLARTVEVEPGFREFAAVPGFEKKAARIGKHGRLDDHATRQRGLNHFHALALRRSRACRYWP